MPAIVPLIVSALAGLTGGSVVAGLAISIGLTIGLGFAARALMPKPRLGDFRTRGTTIMLRDSATPHRVIYGETAIRGRLRADDSLHTR